MRDPMDDRERRLCLRVKYEPGNGPTLVIGESKYEVIDISEKGIKFITDYPEWFGPGLKEVEADILFSDGKSRKIRGAVMRIERAQFSSQAEVVIFLYEGCDIPISWIEQELGSQPRPSGEG